MNLEQKENEIVKVMSGQHVAHLIIDSEYDAEVILQEYKDLVIEECANQVNVAVNQDKDKQQ